MVIKAVVGCLVCFVVAILLFFVLSPTINSQNGVLDGAGLSAISASSDQSSIVQPLPSDPSLQRLSSAASDSVIDVEREQPDKSLPIPGHQLQKMMTDKDAADALDQRIKSLDESIAAIDASLSQNSIVLASVAAPASVDKKTKTAANSSDINQRIQHLRDHLKE